MGIRRKLRHLQISIAAISAAAGALIISSPARAQNAEAEALFSDGTQRMAEGKLDEACEAFEASNRIEPRAGTLIRLGECREANQQLASAWSAYKDALTRVKDSRKRKVAAAKVAAIEPRLSYLTVSVSDESRVDGLMITRNSQPFDPVLWNRALPVDGGDYVIAGRASGHEEWQTTAHVPAEGARISVEVPKFKELGKLAPPPVRVEGARKSLEEPKLEEPSKPAPSPVPVEEARKGVEEPKLGEPGKPARVPAPAVKARAEPHARKGKATSNLFTPRRKVAIGLAGASLVSAAAGVVLGVSARGKRDDAYELCPDLETPCAEADRSSSLIDSSYNRALAANISFGVAAAAAIGAGVLWFTGAPSAEGSTRVSLVPNLVPSEPSVVVMGRF